MAKSRKTEISLEQRILETMRPGILYARGDLMEWLEITPLEWKLTVPSMVESGKLTRQGTKRGTRYQLAGSDGPADNPIRLLSERAKEVLNAFASKIVYSRSELLENLDISVSAWNRAIAELVANGVVLREGDRRGARYQLAELEHNGELFSPDADEEDDSEPLSRKMVERIPPSLRAVPAPTPTPPPPPPPPPAAPEAAPVALHSASEPTIRKRRVVELVADVEVPPPAPEEPPEPPAPPPVVHTAESVFPSSPDAPGKAPVRMRAVSVPPSMKPKRRSMGMLRESPADTLRRLSQTEGMTHPALAQSDAPTPGPGPSSFEAPVTISPLLLRRERNRGVVGRFDRDDQQLARELRVDASTRISSLLATRGLPREFWAGCSALFNAGGGTLLLGARKRFGGSTFIKGVRTPGLLVNAILSELGHRDAISRPPFAERDVRVIKLADRSLVRIDLAARTPGSPPCYVGHDSFSRRPQEGCFQLREEELVKCTLSEVKALWLEWTAPHSPTWLNFSSTEHPVNAAPPPEQLTKRSSEAERVASYVREHPRLSSKTMQRLLLDICGSHSPDLDELSELFGHHKQLSARIDELLSSGQLRVRNGRYQTSQASIGEAS